MPRSGISACSATRRRYGRRNTTTSSPPAPGHAGFTGRPDARDRGLGRPRLRDHQGGRGPPAQAGVPDRRPRGDRALNRAMPDVPIHVGAIDECLNAVGFIYPGLGDAGDRQFGTATEA